MQNCFDLRINCDEKDRFNIVGRILRGVNECMQEEGTLAVGFPEWISPVVDNGSRHDGDPGSVVRVFASGSQELSQLFRVWDIAIQIENEVLITTNIYNISSRINGYQRFVRDRLTEKRLSRKSSGGNGRILHSNMKSMPVAIPVGSARIYVFRESVAQKVFGEFGGFGLSCPGGATIPCL